jgi:hypothetical protein
VIYQPLLKKDTLIILQGLIFFLAIIFTGVGVAQYQLVNLTQKNEMAAIAALDWDKSRYLDYFNFKKGEKYFEAKRLWAEKIPKEAFLICKELTAQIDLPDKIARFKSATAEIRPELKLVYFKLQQDAYAAKKYFEAELKDIGQYLAAAK